MLLVFFFLGGQCRSEEEEKVMCVGADLFMGLLLLDPTLLNHLFILMVKVLPF